MFSYSSVAILGLTTMPHKSSELLYGRKCLTGVVNENKGKTCAVSIVLFYFGSSRHCEEWQHTCHHRPAGAQALDGMVFASAGEGGINF
jgi:hypothetical protein